MINSIAFDHLAFELRKAHDRRDVTDDDPPGAAIAAIPLLRTPTRVRRLLGRV